MPWMMSAPWVLIRHLRTIMASSAEPQGKLDSIVRAIAANMIAEVSSIYIRLADGTFELYATEGLRREAVHKLRMAKGEGLVGVIARWGEPVNLPDAQKHPQFSYKPETGEEAFHSFLGVPILRDQRTLGVLTVQNKIAKNYSEEEVEALQTTAMVLAEMFGAGTFTGTLPAPVDKRGASLTVKASPLAEGLALGHIALHEPRPEIVKFFADNIPNEVRRLDDAIERLKSEMDLLAARKTLTGSAQEDILESVRMLAGDKGWARRMQEAVSAGLTAEAAVDRVQLVLRNQMTRHGDDYWRERALDLEGLSNRLLRILAGNGDTDPKSMPTDAIIVARNMAAAELMEYSSLKPRGLILEEGGATSHVAIVARSLGLAAVMQARDVLSYVRHGDPAVLDAETGEIHIRPSLELIRAYADKVRSFARRTHRFQRVLGVTPLTKDSQRIGVHMNAGLLVDIATLPQSGADGIGLFRTELQFMTASKWPTRSEQQDIYRQVLDAAEEKRVVFRAADVGGDKTLPYMKIEGEANPALGWRAIRISLDRPAMFRTQVRALLRAASGRELNIMIPFVTEITELTAAKHLIDKETAYSRRYGYELPKVIRLGVMIEVPAIVYQLDRLLPLVDFISVGSNDLLQFLFAADRENERVARRFDSLSCAALRLLHEIAVKASRHNVEFTLCGEMAGRPLEALALIGLGYRSLSMAPASIGPVKAMIISANAAEVQNFMMDILDRHVPDIRQELTAFARKQSIDL